jgi:hypothetical protein
VAGAQRIATRKRRSLSLKISEGRLLGPAPKQPAFATSTFAGHRLRQLARR